MRSIEGVYLRTLGPLIGNCLDYHLKLRKSETAKASQLRSRKEGLNISLHKARVPGIDNARCNSSWAKQGQKHMLPYCLRARWLKTKAHEQSCACDVRAMLTEGRGIRATRGSALAGQIRRAEPIPIGWGTARSRSPH